MIKDEKHQPEIMKAFAFKTSTQLKTSYMNALIDEGPFPAIKSGRKVAKPTISNEVNVGKRGSIIMVCSRVVANVKAAYTGVMKLIDGGRFD